MGFVDEEHYRPVELDLRDRCPLPLEEAARTRPHGDLTQVHKVHNLLHCWHE